MASAWVGWLWLLWPLVAGCPNRTAPVQSSRVEASAATTRYPSIRAHAADVVDYTLRATLDADAHTVHGDGTIRWRNESRRPTRELWLHLYLNAFKNERSAFLRERVGGRGSVLPNDWGFIAIKRLAMVDSDGTTTNLVSSLETKFSGDDDETDARVALPRQILPGETLLLDVAFDDKLPSIVERTGYAGSFHMVAQWFPKIARLDSDGTWAHFPFHHLAEFYADFGTYDVTLDVPATFSIGATGPVVEEHVVDGRRIERHVQGDVHDFAFAAWDGFQALRETIDGVDVKLLYPLGFDSVAARDLAALRFALPYEAARFGPYPYAVLTLVHPQRDASEAGGMEYPTLITGDGPWWTPSGIHSPEIVAVHELGHQWFYGLVASNEAAWPFLDEGLTQFAEVDAMEKWRGAGSASDLFGVAVSDAVLQAVAGNAAAADEPVAQAASAFSSGANYGRLVYGRTATVLATMARVYGDAALGDALGLYARTFRFEHPVPDDLLATFARELGPNAATTLRAALFDRGWVDYAIDGVRSHRTANGGATWEGSVVVRRRGTLTFPVEVELLFADGSTRREHWDGEGSSVVLPWGGGVALRAARVDPDDRILIDRDPSNNVGQASGERTLPVATFERLLYFAQLAVQAFSP